jgi:hypothetical protein
VRCVRVATGTDCPTRVASLASRSSELGVRFSVFSPSPRPYPSHAASNSRAPRIEGIRPRVQTAKHNHTVTVTSISDICIYIFHFGRSKTRCSSI